MNIGEKIYELRKVKNLSQEELGDILSVSRQTISKWETGETIPEIGKLIKMCDYFELNLNDFVRDKNLTVKNKRFIQQFSLSTIIIALLNVLTILAIILNDISISDSIISITSILILSLIVILVINSQKKPHQNDNKIKFKVIVTYMIITLLVIITLGGIIYLINCNQKHILLDERTYTNIENINSSLLSGDIKLLQSNDNKVLVKIYANKKNINVITLEESDNTLIIEQTSAFNNLIIKNKIYLEVYLPIYSDITFDITTKSGNISSDVKVNGNFSTKSGDIKINELFNSNIKSTSGSIILHKAQNIYEIKSNSGKIKINKLTDFDNITSKSADIKIEELIINKDSKIVSTSGNVRIKKFNGIVNAKSNSGDQTINQVRGNYILNINTTSGNISVNN